MKAAYQLDGDIHVGEVPDPVPGAGQVLVRTHACGLCASDVHLLKGGQDVVDASRESAAPTQSSIWAGPSCPVTSSSHR